MVDGWFDFVFILAVSPVNQHNMILTVWATIEWYFLFCCQVIFAYDKPLLKFDEHNLYCVSNAWLIFKFNFYSLARIVLYAKLSMLLLVDRQCARLFWLPACCAFLSARKPLFAILSWHPFNETELDSAFEFIISNRDYWCGNHEVPSGTSTTSSC